MNLTEAINALLANKFPGVRKDALKAMAGMMSLHCEDENAAKQIVDHMTAEKVSEFAKSYRSDIDREVNQSVQTNETKLREKYNFIEKSQPKPAEGLPTGNGALTLDQIKALFAEQLNPVMERMDAYDKQRQSATRRETYVGKLKEAKLNDAMVDMMASNFDRMQFADDAEFNAFLMASQSQIDVLAQAQANASLRNDRTPNFGGVVNDGVSNAVSAYLNKTEANPLGGKQI